MPALIKQSVIKPAIFTAFPGVAAGMSTRHGGVSKPPYATLNLANSGPDDAAHRSENRRRFCAALGFSPEQMVRSHQVHGVEILQASQCGVYEGYDAFITRQPGLLLAASVADCTPILIFDAQNNAIAAIHAGWKGTVAQLVRHTLERMHAEYGTVGAHCFAYIGPCIDECSFEVGEEVAVHFSDRFKTWNPEAQKFFVDLKAANAAQLTDWGVPAAQIEVSPWSTVLHNATFFSHRHERGETGRMLAAIGLL
jgi:polyphenol oxidase